MRVSSKSPEEIKVPLVYDWDPDEFTRTHTLNIFRQALTHISPPRRRSGWLTVLLLGLTTSSSGQLVINEVLFNPSGTDSGRQLIELRNPGAAAFDMGETGYWLYWPPARWQFPPGVTVPAGGNIVVHINRPGEPGDGEYFTGVAGTRNLAASDAVGLFRSNAFTDPAAVLDFVQWGSGGHNGEEIANMAGVWTPLDFVDVSTLREGASISYDGSGDGGESWCVDGTPTLGSDNDECTVSFARSQVRLSEIGFLRAAVEPSHYAVELKHEGVDFEDMSGRWLALDGAPFLEFPAATVLAPGESLIVHLGIEGVDGLFDVYSGEGLTWRLRESGSASLHAGAEVEDWTRILDFVSWGEPAVHQEVAVEAGIWSEGEAVDSSGLRPDGSLAVSVREDAPAFGAARWFVDNTGTIGRENDAPPRVPLVINEVLIDPRGEEPGMGAVELKNRFREAVDVEGYTLCVEIPVVRLGLRCFSIPSSLIVPPDGFLIVRWNSPGVSDENTVFTGSVLDFHPSGGSLSLYVFEDDSNEHNLVDYVRWGDIASDRESQAALVGIWPVGDSVDVAGIQDNTSLAYSGDGDTAASYRLDDSPSIGEENVEPPPQESFRRGDCNDDGNADISDAIVLFNFLFIGMDLDRRKCKDACDANDDEQEDISDPVFILNTLFRGGAVIPEPRDDCGADPTPGTLSCAAYESC